MGFINVLCVCVNAVSSRTWRESISSDSGKDWELCESLIHVYAFISLKYCTYSYDFLLNDAMVGIVGMMGF